MDEAVYKGFEKILTKEVEKLNPGAQKTKEIDGEKQKQENHP